MDSEELYRRSRERHFEHSSLAGICPICIREVLVEMALEQNPGMARDDARKLAEEWFMSPDDELH